MLTALTINIYFMHLLLQWVVLKTGDQKEWVRLNAHPQRTHHIEGDTTETQLVTLPNECLQGKCRDITLLTKVVKAIFFPQ